jgi:hypothetical protein
MGKTSNPLQQLCYFSKDQAQAGAYMNTTPAVMSRVARMSTKPCTQHKDKCLSAARGFRLLLVHDVTSPCTECAQHPLVQTLGKPALYWLR